MRINLKALKNSRTELYQWDTDRQIEITPDDGIVVDEIHYATVMLREALVVLPHVVDGTYIADIPNILLQSANTIHIYVVTHTANGERTIDDTTLGVTRRKKPSDYVYTETEVMRYENLEKRIEELEKYGGGSGITEEELNEIANYIQATVQQHDVSAESHEDLRKQVEVHEEFLIALENELKMPFIIEATRRVYEDGAFKIDCDVTFEEVKKSLDNAVPVVKLKSEGDIIGFYEIYEVTDNKISFIKTSYFSEEKIVGSFVVYCTREKWYAEFAVESFEYYAKKKDIPTELPASDVYEWAKQPTKPSYTAEEVGADEPVKRIEKSSSDTQATLKPNELYVFPEMAELSVDLEANPDTDIVSEYHFIFTSGSTATVLSLPEDVKVPSNFLIESNKAYEISILEMMMLVQSWEIN